MREEHQDVSSKVCIPLYFIFLFPNGREKRMIDVALFFAVVAIFLGLLILVDRIINVFWPDLKPLPWEEEDEIRN